MAKRGRYFGVVGYSSRIVMIGNDSEEADQSRVKKGPMGNDRCVELQEEHSKGVRSNLISPRDCLQFQDSGV